MTTTSLADSRESQAASCNSSHIVYSTLQQTCAHIHAKVQRFLEKEHDSERWRATQNHTRESLAVIRQALERYRLEELSFSYNGGKDCLVLLILYLCALHEHFGGTPTTRNNGIANASSGPLEFPKSLQSVYIVSEHPFPQVDKFVEESSREYHLDIIRYSKPMRDAFGDYLAENTHVKAIFVGTRRTDPHGQHLVHFDPTDRGWPSFMRIHPVIDWSYVDIWAFIRGLEIPYCPLYDQGYTSLGGMLDTHPNPALVADSAQHQYLPAYELQADEAERLGRSK